MSEKTVEEIEAEKAEARAADESAIQHGINFGQHVASGFKNLTVPARRAFMSVFHELAKEELDGAVGPDHK